MSRDFILIFSGGIVSLVTTLIVLFIADYLYRREQMKPLSQTANGPAPTPKPEPTRATEHPLEPPLPPESKLLQTQEEKST